MADVIKLKQVEAYEAWAVFASYDGNAPDTSDLVLFATEEVADEFVAFMKTPKGDEFGLCYNEGHEWCKAFLVRRVVTTKPETVWYTVWEFIESEEY